MEYQFLTQDQRDNIVAEAMKQREIEHFHYAHNANTYDAMLAVLPAGDWPEDLAFLKNKNREQIVRESPPERLAEAMDYSFRDQLQVLKNTEMLERDKVDRIYQALETQFGGDDARKLAAINRINIVNII